MEFVGKKRSAREELVEEIKFASDPNRLENKRNDVFLAKSLHRTNELKNLDDQEKERFEKLQNERDEFTFKRIKRGEEIKKGAMKDILKEQAAE